MTSQQTQAKEAKPFLRRSLSRLSLVSTPVKLTSKSKVQADRPPWNGSALPVPEKSKTKLTPRTPKVADIQLQVRRSPLKHTAPAAEPDNKPYHDLYKMELQKRLQLEKEVEILKKRLRDIGNFC